MKRNQPLRYKILLVFIIAWGQLLANPGEERRKEINRSFNVNPSTEFTVRNEFGSIHIDTWDKSEIKVKVEVIARGRNAGRAQSLLDKIEIAIREGYGTIGFSTDMKSNMETNDQESFEVNYTISAPAGNPMTIENKFGDTYLGNRTGKMQLTFSYGNLKSGDLTGPLDLDMSFGNAAIGATTSSKIRAKYSELEIRSGETMDLEQKFSDVGLETVKDLKLESRYGSVEIGVAERIDADAQFSGFSIGDLSGSLYMEASYVSGFEIARLQKTFSKVEILGKFSSYEIWLEQGFRAELEAEFGFSDLQYTGGKLDLYHQVKEDNRSEYKGRIGGGDADKKIVVKSSYGDLKLKFR